MTTRTWSMMPRDCGQYGGDSAHRLAAVSVTVSWRVSSEGCLTNYRPVLPDQLTAATATEYFLHWTSLFTWQYGCKIQCKRLNTLGLKAKFFPWPPAGKWVEREGGVATTLSASVFLSLKLEDVRSGHKKYAAQLYEWLRFCLFFRTIKNGICDLA